MPEDWLEEWGEESPVKLPSFTRDEPKDYPPTERIGQVEDRNRRKVEELVEKVLPLIG
jgi:hypothetical protein